MKSFSAFVGTTVLTTAMSLAHATDTHIIWIKNTPESNTKVVEHVKAQTNNILLPAIPRLVPEAAEANDEKMLNYLRGGVRSSITPDSQFVIGNSRWLRLGVEFNLSPEKTNRSSFNDSRVWVGVFRHGVGVQWTAKF